MGRIFISAGHGGLENGVVDPGAPVAGTTEAEEMKRLRDWIVPELESRNLTVFSVPDPLSAADTLAWINARCQASDVALEIHAGASSDPVARGATVYHIANNDARKGHAELLLLALLRRVPQLPSRGAKPDTSTALGELAFCRRLQCPSLYMEVAYLTNAQDRELLQTRTREFALGIADGMASWSRAITNQIQEVSGTLPDIGISVNGGLYGERGVIINDNAFVPIDLADLLGVDLSDNFEVRRVRYRNVVYIKAVDLRNFNISVGWDASTRTVLLKSPSVSRICPGLIDSIMGHGNATQVQLSVFLRANNDQALVDFPDLPKLYREEGTIEGVNYDIAFAQMCVETNFLRFDGVVQPVQNNFAGLGDADGGPEGASFASARIGVRAQIQHLKAYASTEPLVQQLVDPRFRFISRGVAPLVGQLSGRWAADPQYGERILVQVRRLYESAGLL
ncbi:MAG: N-acetylmuramoyl-L-alanine amidase [Cyanobacteria bacterium P01_C01_bin.73]